MTHQLQIVFSEFLENKRKVADIRAAIKDALKNSKEYQELEEKMAQLREKKKRIELAIKESFISEVNEMEDLKLDIASEEEQMTFDALALFAKGEEVIVRDSFDNEYTVDFKVRFKRKE